MSISSTVAMLVGVTAGVRSTGSPFSAASTRSRLVMVSWAFVIWSLLGARGREHAAARLHLLLAHHRAQVLGAPQQEADQRVVAAPAGEAHDRALALVRVELRQLRHPLGDRRRAACLPVAHAMGVH